ncbi:related to Ribosomal RNA-processing protein 12 [Saccharomycodes ludwigii]|uniref:Related to Ribosomal RNA-processing protein 12 n=1 Tax=Saccharomycodes ludwigii TaxID=36035 RepID=A0A376B9M2_9ASCO|nr:hypothetical protein SCDLUD_000563 [Saccharomycodes ludwigii]KAH3902963.1 hypothetical protein SCDLUD_000563 [Saccharomycodes ludwigii]SSD61385.1 related to Ribosomal RNA-processing protein 12 [Saccharomycodes ludwigii]
MDEDQAAHLLELEERLSKIRSQINSKLDNQRHIAIILSAVEENLVEQDASIDKNIVNYIISFLSVLDQSVDNETREIKDLTMATSSIYLLDLIFQYTPKSLLQNKFPELLTKIAPCITDPTSQAPLIRSAIGCLESLLIAQDSSSWINRDNLKITPIRGLNGVLELCLDPRPKIRKRSLDTLSKILLNPPPSPSREHIASQFVADYAIKVLVTSIENSNNPSDNTLFIHVLKMFQVICSTNQWPTSKLEKLCDLLLEIVKNANTSSSNSSENGTNFVINAVFQVFDSLFNNNTISDDKLVAIINAISSLKPSKNDPVLVKSWVSIVTKSMESLSRVNGVQLFKIELLNFFQLMSAYLDSNSQQVVNISGQSLITIINIIDQKVLIGEDDEDEIDSIIQQVAKFTTTWISSIKYSHALGTILQIITQLFHKFSLKSSPSLIPVLKTVGAWRSNEKEQIEYIGECERVIGAAIGAIGPEEVLKVLPLNVGPQAKPDDIGRAWLLPLIRDNTRYSKLSMFFDEFMPIIQFFDKKSNNLPKESVELKIFQTVVDQLWSTLPSFCWLPQDLLTAFTNEVASDLCSTLYSNVELRTVICHALKNLAISNQEDVPDLIYKDTFFPPEVLTSNLDYLRETKCTNLLSVLFNVFSQTALTKRGFILDTIEIFLKISKPEDLMSTFNNICTMLKDALDKETKSANNSESKVSVTLLDLIVAMPKYLPPQSYGALFNIFNTTVSFKDALIQKRSYKIISKLSELDSGLDAISQYMNEIETIMINQSENCINSARSSRLQALKTIIGLLPPDHLYFIVVCAPEVILSTRDVNERTRELAFGTLILMAKKMMTAKDGVIDLGRVASIDSEDKIPSSLAEFFKIISAGLISDSQHMVSATITSYACLVFEFKEQLDFDSLWNIYDTIELYLTSNSREIVKSAIGFIKVVVLSFPVESVRDKIPSLLPKLLRWSHEHTGHFKSKIKNIIERLVRRFGEDFMEGIFPEEDKKLFSNIKKQRNRNNKKKITEEEDNDAGTKNDQQKQNNMGTFNNSTRFMSAFDEVVYASDTEENADGVTEFDEEGNIKRKPGRQKNAQYIVENKENPLDLLDTSTLTHITSSRPKKFNEKSHSSRKRNDGYEYDVEGKIIINTDESNSKNKDTNDDDPLKEINSGINAYLEAVKNGPIRGQKNKLKFKKRSTDNDEFSDDEKMPASSRKPISFKNKIGKKKNFKSRRKL